MAEENIFTIPLKEATKKSERKRSRYSVSLVKEYIARQMKSKDVKIGKFLNEELWSHGNTKSKRRIRVKVVSDGDIWKAELIGHEYQEFEPHKKEGKEIKKERSSPMAQKNKELEEKIGGKEEKAEKAVLPEKTDTSFGK